MEVCSLDFSTPRGVDRGQRIIDDSQSMVPLISQLIALETSRLQLSFDVGQEAISGNVDSHYGWQRSNPRS